jgi:hypothetical protein
VPRTVFLEVSASASTVDLDSSALHAERPTGPPDPTTTTTKTQTLTTDDGDDLTVPLGLLTTTRPTTSG